MPLLKLETTVALTDEKQKTLLAELSGIMAHTTGKPEEYVMVTANTAAILMSGQGGDAAFVDVRGIGGLDGDTNRELSQKICQALNHSLGISPKRVYLNFTDVAAENWGWNETTFG